MVIYTPPSLMLVSEASIENLAIPPNPATQPGLSKFFDFRHIILKAVKPSVILPPSIPVPQVVNATITVPKLSTIASLRSPQVGFVEVHSSVDDNGVQASCVTGVGRTIGGACRAVKRELLERLMAWIVPSRP